MAKGCLSCYYRMKILFFNYEYPPLGGGAGNATSYILREYSKMEGLEVDLVTSAVDEKYSLEKIGENVRIHKIPIGKNKKNFHHQSQKDLLAYARKASAFSEKLAKKNKYDLTHSFFTVPCGFISWRLKKKFKIPYVISLRGADVPGYSERFTFIYKILRPLIRKIWSDAEAVVSNSKGLRDLALKTNEKQEIELIYNGIDIEQFHPDLEKREKEKFIVTIGGTRLTPRKGVRFLIKAVARVAKKHPEIYLKIVGDGGKRESLESLAKELGVSEKVEFVGRVPHESLPQYYQEASLFVLPSMNEGMSNAMLEALASGLAIVSTRTGGADELVEEGKNGFLVEMKNSRDLAEKMLILLNDKEKVLEMGEYSRRKAEGMSWMRVAEEYVGLYKKLVK